MALNSRSGIHPKWFSHSAPASYGLQVATVRIFNKNTSSNVYNPLTNTWSGTDTDLYIGPARIQQLTSVSEAGEDFNPTTLQNVRVVLPYNKNTLNDGEMPDIRPNHFLRVNESPYNDSLESFLFEVIGVLNSSNAWERTIICRVNSEIDPTNV